MVIKKLSFSAVLIAIMAVSMMGCTKSERLMLINTKAFELEDLQSVRMFYDCGDVTVLESCDDKITLKE